MKKIIMLVLFLFMFGTVSAEEGAFNPDYYNPDPFNCAMYRTMDIRKATRLTVNEFSSWASCQFQEKDIPTLEKYRDKYKRMKDYFKATTMTMIISKIKTRIIYENYYKSAGLLENY